MNLLSTLSHGAPVSALLLGLIVGVSLLGLFVWPALVERQMLRPYWLLPKGEFHTLLTSGFIHADLGHLFFNSFTFWAFGFGLERHIGSPTFAALYLVGLLVSGAGTWVQHRREREYRSLGASGAILAVLFASIVYFPSASLFIMPIPVPIPAPLFAVGYLAYSLWAAKHSRGNVNHDAHLWGAAAGLAFVALTDAGAFGRALASVFG
jgi:membrane associated rhomboid family serine protease